MTLFDREMMEALEADGEKLRALTGEEHGPVFLDDDWDDWNDLIHMIDIGTQRLKTTIFLVEFSTMRSMEARWISKL